MGDNFDATQKALDTFLEQQFNTPNDLPQQEQQAKPTEDDEQISQYLNGADETVYDHQLEQARQQKFQPRESESERIIRLERELAASRERLAIIDQQQQAYEQQQRMIAEQQAYQQQQPQQPYTPFSEDELRVDERYKTEYGDADPYIQAIAKRVATDLYQRTVEPLYSEINALQAQLGKAQDVLTFQEQDRYFTQLGNQLKAVVPDADALMADQRFTQWANQRDPFGRGTLLDTMLDQRNRGDVRGMAGLLNEFRRATGAGTQHNAPGRAPQTMPNTSRQPRGKIMSQASFDRATADMRAGRLSWDKYQVIMEEFNQAYLEGRVK